QYTKYLHLPKDTDIISVLKSQITARISVIPDRYIFGKIILRVFSTDIPPHEITTSLFTTQAEKALHPYGLLKEEIKEEAYYCVTISDKELLQIIAHQETPGIKINIYKDINNQPYIEKYYYIIALFDNLLEDEISIKIDIWHEYIYIKGKQYQSCNKCRLLLNTPKAKEHRRLYLQKKSIERKIQKLEKFIKENPDHATKTYKCANCKEYKKYSQFGLGQRGIRTKCADCRNKRKPYFETYFKKKRKIGAYKGQYLIRKAKKLQVQKWKSMKEHGNVQDVDNTDLSSNLKD
ncbi:hypothetical protein C2G38_2158682, partial [Gigaspora rosea]